MSVKNLDCSNIQNVVNVTDQIDYKDKKSGGSGDAKFVSCGQDGNYNELENKFKKHFEPLNVKESLIAMIMCKCCKSLKPTGKEKISWLKFYECMKKRLTIENHPKTIKKLDELILYHSKR